MINALTVDLEDWYHICGIPGYSNSTGWDSFESRIIGNTERLLRTLSAFDVKATFFVLGYIALKEPGLIRMIRDEGHEIATHGFFHRRVFELSEDEFEDDIARSLDAIGAVTNETVLGFRAPEWSIREDTLWALRILRKHGILYDSSMVPLTRMGSRRFPLYPCRLDTEFGEICEFPLSTSRLFWENIPFSGGLPLRITPYFYIISKFKRINKTGYPAMLYVHPWEFDRDNPRIDLPLSRRFMHYFNLKVTPKKVEGILRHFRFAPVKEVLEITE